MLELIDGGCWDDPSDGMFPPLSTVHLERTSVCRCSHCGLKLPSTQTDRTRESPSRAPEKSAGFRRGCVFRRSLPQSPPKSLLPYRPESSTVPVPSESRSLLGSDPLSVPERVLHRLCPHSSPPSGSTVRRDSPASPHHLGPHPSAE